MGDETFKERYLSGEIPFEEIDRYVSRWNNSDVFECRKIP